jgi:hypothetical protein
MHSKVSFNWLPSYIKATWPVHSKWLNTLRSGLVLSATGFGAHIKLQALGLTFPQTII